MVADDANEENSSRWRAQTWYGTTQYTSMEVNVNVYGILNVCNVKCTYANAERSLSDLELDLVVTLTWVRVYAVATE